MKNLYIVSERISLSLSQVRTFSSLHHPVVEKVLNPSFFSPQRGGGSLFTVSERSVVYFIVTKFSDIMNIIIPLFDKHILQGNKRLDYADFCKVALLIKDNAHFTDEGLAQITMIKTGMNTKR